jgi:hypothetical protein
MGNSSVKLSIVSIGASSGRGIRRSAGGRLHYFGLFRSRGSRNLNRFGRGRSGGAGDRSFGSGGRGSSNSSGLSALFGSYWLDHGRRGGRFGSSRSSWR